MSSSTTFYRDASFGVDLRIDDLVTERRNALPAALSQARVRERRAGRIVAGITGIAGGSLLMLLAVASFVPRPARPNGDLQCLLFGAWLAVGIAYALGRVGAKILFGEPGIPRRSGDRWDYLARLEAPLFSDKDRAWTDRLEVWSVALPMMAMALLAPLTIHAVVVGVARVVTGSSPVFLGFDRWIAWSVVLVGHAHVTLAVLSYRFAKEIRALQWYEIEPRGRGLSATAVLWTVAASAVPGAILLLIPPAVTLVTAMLFSPLMFGFMERSVIKERAALGLSKHFPLPVF
jgi:hypothetical protein